MEDIMKNNVKTWGYSSLGLFVLSFLLSETLLPKDTAPDAYTRFEQFIDDFTSILFTIGLVVMIIWIVKAVKRNHRISTAALAEKNRIELEKKMKAEEMQKRYRWLDPSVYAPINYYDALRNGLPSKLIVLDVETTGLYHDSHRIVEISLITYENSQMVDVYTSLVDPELPIPEEATNIHGITDQMVQNKPKIYEIIDEIQRRIAGNIVVGYNVRFDIGFIETALRRSDIIPGPWKAIDVLSVARIATEKISLPDRKLSTMKAYFTIDGESHRSEDDCKVTYEVLLKSIELIDRRNQEHMSIQQERIKKLNPKELIYLDELKSAFAAAGLDSFLEIEIMSNMVIVLSYRDNLLGRVKLRGKDMSIQFIGGNAKDIVEIAEDENGLVYIPRFVDLAKAFTIKKRTSNNIVL